MEEKLGAEIFDVDHTITKNITSLSYLLLLIKRKVFSITILRHIPYICMNYKFGHMADKHFDRHFDEMVGVEQSFLDELAVENFNNMMKKEKVYGDAKRYIDHLKSNNKKIILATSSMETIIKPLADYLGVDAIIATKFGKRKEEKSLSTSRRIISICPCHLSIQTASTIILCSWKWGTRWL